MKAAQRLIKHAAREGVRACFANPGASGMHLVAAFGAVPGTRPPLCPFEGVAAGFGVPAERASAVHDLAAALRRSFATPGPSLIEAMFK
ncbi:MAG: hypothetical protein ABL864_11505 [Terricaulis sp.]